MYAYAYILITPTLKNRSNKAVWIYYIPYWWVQDRLVLTVAKKRTLI